MQRERGTNRFPENASFTIEGRSRMKKRSPQMKAAGFWVYQSCCFHGAIHFHNKNVIIALREREPPRAALKLSRNCQNHFSESTPRLGMGWVGEEQFVKLAQLWLRVSQYEPDGSGLTLTGLFPNCETSLQETLANPLWSCTVIWKR